MSKTRYSFVLGPSFERDSEQKLTVNGAIQQAANRAGKGYVWLKWRGHFALVGNYADGKVFNCQAQAVEARPADWLWLAENHG